MDVLIFGAGGVGLGLGSFLLEAGVAVRFLARPATAELLRRRGLVRSGRFGDREFPPARFLTAETLGQALEPGAPDFVLVATKSFDSESAARSLREAGDALGDAPLVLCQNGWGNAERFAEHFPEPRVWNARVITGFVPSERGVEVTAHAEPVAIGSLFGCDALQVAPLADALDRGGLPCVTTDRIAEVLWAKLLYNGCLNALGAVFGVPYGVLGEHAASRAIVADLAHEIFGVMEAAGYRTRWPTAEDYLRALHEELLPPTAAHESSTLQDLRRGRRTEIDALNGAVVRLAEKHDVGVPVNRTLCGMIRFLESRAAAS